MVYDSKAIANKSLEYEREETESLQHIFHFNNLNLVKLGRAVTFMKCQKQPLEVTCNFIKKETLAQMFSCEFYEIYKNAFFYRTPLYDCF